VARPVLAALRRADEPRRRAESVVGMVAMVASARLALARVLGAAAAAVL